MKFDVLIDADGKRVKFDKPKSYEEVFGKKKKSPKGDK
jgi:hypothetical protein